MSPDKVEVFALMNWLKTLYRKDPFGKVIAVRKKFVLCIVGMKLEGVGRVIRAARSDRFRRNQLER